MGAAVSSKAWRWSALGSATMDISVLLPAKRL
jgi:hypothetical protein